MMRDYKVLWTQGVSTLDGLIEKLLAIQESNQNGSGNVYVLNAEHEYINGVQLAELTLSDGTTVRDVILRTK